MQPLFASKFPHISLALKVWAVAKSAACHFTEDLLVNNFMSYFLHVLGLGKNDHVEKTI